jgi:hypothetical protein
MTEEMGGVNSLIPRAYGYRYTVLYEDYVAIFIASAWKRFEKSAKTEQDEKERDARLAHAVAKAYISYSLETLANGLYKNTGSEEELWCFLSFPELERRLHGAYKMRTLKDAMKEMIEDGYVFKRPNTNPKYNTLEYRMNLEQYRSEIRSLEPKGTSEPKDTSAKMHDEDSSANLHHGTSAKMHEPQCKNARTPSAKMHAIINSNRVTDKQKGTEENAHVSDDNAPTPSHSSLQETSTPPESEETKQPSEQTSKQASNTSYSQSATNNNNPKVKQGNTTKVSSRAEKTAKPAKPELTTEFANDSEQTMWEKLSAKERTFYARMNTQERSIYTGWCSLFKKSRPPLGEAMFDACRTLGSSEYSPETLDNIRKWCFATDKKTSNYPNGYYRERGVKLWDIAEKAPDWELIQEMGPAQKGSLSERRNQAGIKTGVQVGANMPPQKPEPTPEQLNKIEAMMVKMGLKPANKKMIS